MTTRLERHKPDGPNRSLLLEWLDTPSPQRRPDPRRVVLECPHRRCHAWIMGDTKEDAERAVQAHLNERCSIEAQARVKLRDTGTITP